LEWEGTCTSRRLRVNGLLRQYLPKGHDLSRFSQEQLDDIAMLMKARPRKTLAWKAPAELFLPQGAFDFQKYWSIESNQLHLEHESKLLFWISKTPSSRPDAARLPP
jgi:hypothetical protein